MSHANILYFFRRFLDFLLFSPIFTEYRNFQQALTCYLNNSIIEFRIERVSTCSWGLISLIGIRISDIFTFTVCGVHTHIRTHAHIHTYTFIKELFPCFPHTHTNRDKTRRAQTSPSKKTNLSRQQRIQFCALSTRRDSSPCAAQARIELFRSRARGLAQQAESFLDSLKLAPKCIASVCVHAYYIHTSVHTFIGYVYMWCIRELKNKVLNRAPC